ncbi:hypothetical protein BRSU_1579 [Brachyspira suanatina]|uniref:Uncharacterized protein n=1 Tax=Brachyspira suanatina TaxID=381802 RepID=A0A0G4K7E9_9SPIR|nr:glycosyltransferase [Brachyspira suanatina]CRF33650.1 hypothetical protein BRSU_1579 [Brachyspira suanatina]
MENVCQCEECKSGKYNPLDYVVKNEDLKILDEKRPLGISGHLRVKNEAMSLAQSIDSCIDALDELIVTYNTSEDNTEEILKEYQKKYPDKIKLYHYKPDIINYTSTEKELEEFKAKKMFYNTESIHSLANYYNFGCIKIKYRYYLKIDADQIYFKDKLLEVRKALLYDLNNVNKLKEYKKIIKFAKYNIFMEKIAWLIPNMKFRYDFKLKYTYKLYKKIIENLGLFNLIIFYRLANKDNCCYTIAGIQTVMYNNKTYVPKNVNHLKLTTFNSCGNDHSIWIPYSKNKFITSNSPMEIIENNKEGKECPLGFFWLHLAPIKRKINVDKNDLITNILDIKNINLEDFSNSKLKFSEDLSIYWAKIFFNYDKKYLTKEFFDKYFNNILEYIIKHYKQ